MLRVYGALCHLYSYAFSMHRKSCGRAERRAFRRSLCGFVQACLSYRFRTDGNCAPDVWTRAQPTVGGTISTASSLSCSISFGLRPKHRTGRRPRDMAATRNAGCHIIGHGHGPCTQDETPARYGGHAECRHSLSLQWPSGPIRRPVPCPVPAAELLEKGVAARYALAKYYFASP